MKLNCWEFKKCGREPGGVHVRELGVCPAATEGRLDAVHGGRKAGRACWVVAGTLCKGETQGTFAVKFGACEACRVLPGGARGGVPPVSVLEHPAQ